MAMSASVGSIITPFMFVYFACQTYKHMKQFEREVLEISENKSKQRKDDNHDCKHKRKYTVYRERFEHHPDFLPQDEEKGKIEGFSTNFWFLVEDDLTSDTVVKQLNSYQRKYDKLISEIENDDTRWNEFPFKNKPIVYSK